MPSLPGVGSASLRYELLELYRPDVIAPYRRTNPSARSRGRRKCPQPNEYRLHADDRVPYLRLLWLFFPARPLALEDHAEPGVVRQIGQVGDHVLISAGFRSIRTTPGTAGNERGCQAQGQNKVNRKRPPRIIRTVPSCQSIIMLLPASPGPRGNTPPFALISQSPAPLLPSTAQKSNYRL